MTNSGTQPRPSWPGTAVERALTLVAADYRRPVGPIVFAAVLAVAAIAESAKTAGPLSPGYALAFALLGTAPIAVIRKYPGPAIATVLTANAVFIVFARLSWSVAAVVGWLVTLAACPVVLASRPAFRALVLSEVAVLLGSLGLAHNVTPWDASAAEALAVIAAWGAGEMARAKRQAAIDRAAVAERFRDLSARDAVARERASIARELHDVVAHHVSMIAVRAATAPYAVPGLPPPGRAAFAEIADEARSALTDLRVVLGVLRSPDGQGGHDAAPQPRIADLDGLVSRVAGAGTDATVQISGDVRPLAASVELCCYRIVQEALTNAGRHAAGCRVHVHLGYDADALSVRVVTDPPAEPRRGAISAAGQGYGLTGLRERVSILRGEFQAGPDELGGFAVCAVLPAPGQPQAEAVPA